MPDLFATQRASRVTVDANIEDNGALFLECVCFVFQWYVENCGDGANLEHQGEATVLTRQFVHAFT